MITLERLMFIHVQFMFIHVQLMFIQVQLKLFKAWADPEIFSRGVQGIIVFFSGGVGVSKVWYIFGNFTTCMYSVYVNLINKQ